MKVVLDHIGIVVSNLGEALAFYRDALGFEISVSEEVETQGVRAHFLATAGTSLELLEVTTDSSPVLSSSDTAGQACIILLCVSTT